MMTTLFPEIMIISFSRIKPLLLLALVFLSGCAAVKNEDFVVVRAGFADTPASLARQYLGDAALAGIVTEFNGTAAVSPGQQLVIPLRSDLGGLRKDGYQTVPVLVYHGFSRKKSGKRMIVAEKDFAEQMQYLHDEGFAVVSLAALFDFMEFKKPLPAKAVVLTVDDGWCSLYEIAYPILKRYGYPMTAFLYTDLIGHEKCLNWQQLREMAENGLDIQSHTMSHRDLSRMRKGESFRRYFQDIQNEIAGAERLIEENLGRRCEILAYPYGAYNEILVAYLRKRGYRGAVTVNRGSVPFFADRYRVNRSAVYGGYSIEQFAKNLSTFTRQALN